MASIRFALTLLYRDYLAMTGLYSQTLGSAMKELVSMGFRPPILHAASWAGTFRSIIVRIYYTVRWINRIELILSNRKTEGMLSVETVNHCPTIVVHFSIWACGTKVVVIE